MSRLLRVVSALPAEAEGRQSPKGIGTHDGTFHADEVLAIAMLTQLAAHEDCAIVRTRCPEQLARCELRVDVGGQDDPSTGDFDHHQRGFARVMAKYERSTKLSSAGLVYAALGPEIVRAFLLGQGDPPSSAALAALCRYVYTDFVEAVDGDDNGVEPFEGSRRYVVSTDLPSRIQGLNGAWNGDRSPEAQNAAFATAVELARREFGDFVTRAFAVWWPARAEISEALNAAPRYHCDGRIAVLGRYCPYETHLYELEQEASVAGRTWMILYEDVSSSTWRIKAVATEAGGFQPRRELPLAWAGLKGHELEEACGVAGAVFVHAGRFIGAGATKAAALAMAQKALL
jgi:uncharacterized UPF0160 family protein